MVINLGGSEISLAIETELFQESKRELILGGQFLETLTFCHFISEISSHLQHCLMLL